jgi:protoporphyrinogen oxidase
MTGQLGILGAGASGLTLAMLTNLDFLILERLPFPGGHARSTAVDGWVFDQGPHIMFSRNQFLLECMLASLGSNVHRCRRNNKVAVEGVLARYPIENDLAALPLPTRSRAMIDLIQAPRAQAGAANLAEWFEAHFGETLTSLYFRPYNEKVWKVPLERLSMTWSERIPQPPLEDVIRGALGEQSEGYLHQLYYHYPLHGGYSALMDAWAAAVPNERMVLGSTVTRVIPRDNRIVVECEDGQRVFQRVVSTLPLGRLVEMVPDVPPSVRDAVERLIVNPIIVTTFGYRGIAPNQFTAVYIPDADFLVNRVSYPAVFSPHNAPAGCFSVQAEITTAPGSDLRALSDEYVFDHVLAGLRQRSLVPPDSVPVFKWIERFDDGYVVYTRGYEEDLRLATAWFEQQGIVIHGRFGRHQYLNVDGCLADSIALARRLGASITDADILERLRGASSASAGRPVKEAA